MQARGWQVSATGSAGNLEFDDFDRVRMALDQPAMSLSSVPPEDVTGGDDVLMPYGGTIAASPARWRGYLSSTGVYGDTGGAWVDESAPIGTGTARRARAAADQRWLDLGAHVFRLPGIYGPGRSALERVRSGQAHRDRPARPGVQPGACGRYRQRRACQLSPRQRAPITLPMICRAARMR